MEELRNKLIELGADCRRLNLDNQGGMYVNCVDAHYIAKENGKYKIKDIGGSRFSRVLNPGFTDAEECAKYIWNEFYQLTNEDINKIYRQIAGAIFK